MGTISGPVSFGTADNFTAATVAGVDVLPTLTITNGRFTFTFDDNAITLPADIYIEGVQDGNTVIRREKITDSGEVVTAPSIVSPANESALTGSSQIFGISNPSNIPVAILVGSQEGLSDHHDTGALQNATGFNISELPENAGILHVTLNYDDGSGIKSKFYTYTSFASSEFDQAASEASFAIYDHNTQTLASLPPTAGTQVTIRLDWVKLDGTRLTQNIEGLSDNVGNNIQFETSEGKINVYTWSVPNVDNATLTWGSSQDVADGLGLATKFVDIDEVAVTSNHLGPDFVSTLGAPSDSQNAVLPKSGNFIQLHPKVRFRRVSVQGEFSQNYQNNDPTHGYSNRNDTYSGNGDFLKVASAVMDAETLNVVRNHPFSKSTFSQSDNKSYGFHFDNTVLRSANADGTNQQVIRDMADFGFQTNAPSNRTTIGTDEGNMSLDGRYIPIADNSQCGVYDIVNNRMSNLITIPANYNLCTVSMTGKYFLVMQALIDGNVANDNFRRWWAYEINPSSTALENPRLVHEWSEHDCMVLDTAGDDWIFMVGNPSRFVRVKDGAVSWCSSGDNGHSSPVTGERNLAMASYNANGIVFVKLEPSGSPTSETITTSTFGSDTRSINDSRNLVPASSIVRDEYQNIAACYQNIMHHRGFNGGPRGAARFDGNRGMFKSNWNGQVSPQVSWEFELTA